MKQDMDKILQEKKSLLQGSCWSVFIELISMIEQPKESNLLNQLRNQWVAEIVDGPLKFRNHRLSFTDKSILAQFSMICSLLKSEYGWFISLSLLNMVDFQFFE